MRVRLRISVVPATALKGSASNLGLEQLRVLCKQGKIWGVRGSLERCRCDRDPNQTGSERAGTLAPAPKWQNPSNQFDIFRRRPSPTRPRAKSVKGGRFQGTTASPSRRWHPGFGWLPADLRRWGCLSTDSLTQ